MPDLPRLRAIHAISKGSSIPPYSDFSLPFPLYLVQLIRRCVLRSCPLAPHRQAHSMPLAPVRTHVPQSRNVIPQLPPQFVFDSHTREHGCQVQHLLISKRAKFCRGVDVLARHYVRGDEGADAVEGGQGSLVRCLQ